MCSGVTNGFAFLKFSGSPNSYGNKNANTNNIKLNTTIPHKSFKA
uniref:Uncharacterized protein n=1 Tax=Amphimedon queenslandica TaxID=400682 RepID=A0A1X7UEA0_AMPQE